ncbi:hypothetical protein EBB07_28235 [Paenibacillaceae bacterium]|nr:hypothetical protein EBB07_28235 [Paenibacillaceae bacterium]
MVRVNVNDKIELKSPNSSVVNRLVINCKSSTFDEAKREWQLEDIVDKTSDRFKNKCCLCHNCSLKYNFIIFNPNTEKFMHVGSTCIIRFGLIDGNIDFESGAAIINNFIDEKYYTTEIRASVSSVMFMRPEGGALKNFHELLKSYFEMKGINNPTQTQLLQLCYGERWTEVLKDPFKPHWIMNIWKNPGSIETVKTKKVHKDPVFKEGTTLGHKTRKSQVYAHSAGRSDIYNVQKHVVNNS